MEKLFAAYIKTFQGCLPPFHNYGTFLFETPLITLRNASVNHTLFGKCAILPQVGSWARRNKDGTKLSRKFALASHILTRKRL